MLRLLSLILILLLSSYSLQADNQAPAFDKKNPQATVYTSRGNFTIELYPDLAPVTVANFLHYVQNGFYEGVIFHRVISNKIIQTGGHTRDLKEKPTLPPIINESNNGLHNERWSVAMARKIDPDSATSQFFINMKLNTEFDYQPEKPGYAVFGKVIDGQHVVRAISLVATESHLAFENLPLKPVVIERISIQ